MLKEIQELQRKELESLLESPNNEKQKEASKLYGEKFKRLRTNRCFTDVNGFSGGKICCLTVVFLDEPPKP